MTRTANRRRQAKIRAVGAASAVLLVIPACTPQARLTAADATAPPPSTTSDKPSAGPAGAAGPPQLLDALRIQPEATKDTYQRDDYGPRWADVDANGCNTRDDVLLEQAVAGTVRTTRQRSCDHDVLAGTWIDFYTGETMTFTDLKDQKQAQAASIDHLVALEEAHQSAAAATWTAQRRLEFANDPANLRVTDGALNSAKGSRDPAEWIPTDTSSCAYATAYIRVKITWQLTVDQAEHDALADLLDGCGAG